MKLLVGAGKLCLGAELGVMSAWFAVIKILRPGAGARRCQPAHSTRAASYCGPSRDLRPVYADMWRDAEREELEANHDLIHEQRCDAELSRLYPDQAAGRVRCAGRLAIRSRALPVLPCSAPRRLRSDETRQPDGVTQSRHTSVTLSSGVLTFRYHHAIDSAACRDAPLCFVVLRTSSGNRHLAISQSCARSC
jgi:hypothetical protein